MKAIALLSGGLDSTLAARVMIEQGIELEALNFLTIFCTCTNRGETCLASQKAVEALGIPLKIFNVSEEYLDVVRHPKHGYGSNMNPCIDCRILMMKKAKELMQKIGANFLVTGEVLNERPFSQRKDSMLHIEKEAGLEGRILRPLSAKILPETEPEKKKWVDREKLFAIKGRRRLPQIELARKLDVKDYPCPSGGCLLTDPRFAERLKEHLAHEKKLTLKDTVLLRIGRHFRLGEAKIIVGRNEEENKKLLAIAKNQEISWLECLDYEGPVTLLVGEEKPELLEKAATITARYSDGPKEIPIRVICKGKKEQIIEIKAIKDEALEKLRI